MKLFLYSSWQLTPENRAALVQLVGKRNEDITFAAITNSADLEEDSKEWVEQSYGSLGPHVEVVDLRNWRDNREGLQNLLASKDVIWLCGGNAYYLRWLLKDTGADEIITYLVRQGKVVYAGWSAGAVVAGPTLHHFETVEDISVVAEPVYDGLGLSEAVIVPHMDLDDFAEGMKKVNEDLKQAGFKTAPLTEAQALVIDGDTQRII